MKSFVYVGMLLLPLAAMAAPTSEGKPRATHFQRVDANKDGTITAKEWRMKNDKYFEKLDTNRDQQLSIEEWRAKNDRSLAETDTNRDGKITSEEMTARKEKRRAQKEAKKMVGSDGKQAIAPAR